VSKPETPAQKSIRRRRQIDRREKTNAELREKYRDDAGYRAAKVEASRRQNAALTTAKKGELTERRCAKRARAHPEPRSWWFVLERPVTLTRNEIEHPTYIVIDPRGKRSIEFWPPSYHDPAEFWLASSAGAAAAPRGGARLRSLIGCYGGRESRAAAT